MSAEAPTSSHDSIQSEDDLRLNGDDPTPNGDDPKINGDSSVPSKPLVWGDFFMFVALLSSKRSRDRDTQAGACIVDKQNRIVAIGYNGLPRNYCDEELLWLTCNEKDLYIVHAEANAILNRNTASLKDTVLYTTVFPCNACAKLIIQSGITKVFYISDRHENEVVYRAAKQLFDKTKVCYARYELKRRQYELDFNKILRRDLLLWRYLEKDIPIETFGSGFQWVDYLEWPDYFLAMSLLSAGRSKDPRTQVGACIVDETNRILSIGYNGMPRTCPPHSNDDFPWGKDEHNKLNDKTLYVVHAEANAILNRNAASIDGMRLYTTLFPCNECAKLIIQSGIKEVFYISDMYIHKPIYKASKVMFQSAGIAYVQLMPMRKRILLDFDKLINDDPAIGIENLKLNDSIDGSFQRENSGKI